MRFGYGEQTVRETNTLSKLRLCWMMKFVSDGQAMKTFVNKNGRRSAVQF